MYTPHSKIAFACLFMSWIGAMSLRLTVPSHGIAIAASSLSHVPRSKTWTTFSNKSELKMSETSTEKEINGKKDEGTEVKAEKSEEESESSGAEEELEGESEGVNEKAEETSDKIELDPNAELKAEIEALEREYILAEKRLIEAKESIKEKGKTGYLLLAAEVDNYRKRRANDRSSMQEQAIADVLKAFVPVFNKFDEAEICLNLETENEKKFSSNYLAIYRQLETVCTKMGMVDFYGVEGESFSPAIHEMVGEENASLRKGAVLECTEKGRKHKSGTILSKSKVIVSLGPKPEEKSPENVENEGEVKNAEKSTGEIKNEANDTGKIENDE